MQFNFVNTVLMYGIIISSEVRLFPTSCLLLGTISFKVNLNDRPLDWRRLLPSSDHFRCHQFMEQQAICFFPFSAILYPLVSTRCITRHKW